ncbi:MAG: replicative DNA helicase [Caulobacter sp.]|nr:replicative DNA helicase [Caulobacter sp.]
MMSLVPALDLRPPIEEPTINVAPHNMEAEQALLGILLYDNAAYERLSDNLQARCFYEPFHQRLFQAIETHVRKGQLAEPILLADEFKNDPAFQELGGLRYLADLVDRAPPAANAGDYARVIFDLSLRRELIRIGGDIATAAQGGGGDEKRTARDQIEAAEQQLYSLAESGAASSGFVSFGDALRGAVEMTAEAYSRDGGMSGVATDLIDLDQKIGGLHPSDLIVLAGRPSMGKTALATNIAFNIAKKYAYEIQPDGTRKTVQGGVVAFYSLEMSAEQLAARILSEASEVPSEQIRRGDMTEAEFRRFVDAAKALEACPLYIDDTPSIPISQLAARARRLKRTHGLDLLIIDYLQLARGTADNRVQEIAEISMGLKAIAKELNIPVVALSQLSRQVESREDKRPQLSDLRESGSIEQDADVVMFVFREEYYKEREKPGDHELDKMAEWQEAMSRLHAKAEVIIGKQRHGPIGTVELSFESQFTRFGNLVKPWQQDGGGQNF